MALLNSQRNGVQKPYGVMFDEAKLQAIFAKISQLETGASTETATIAKEAGLQALRSQIAGRQSAASAMQSADHAIFVKAAVAMTNPDSIKTAWLPNPNYDGSFWAYDVTTPSNDAVSKGFAAFIRLLGDFGFSSATISSATTAIGILSKYSLYVPLQHGFRNNSGNLSANGYIIGSDRTPKTSAVARAISAELFKLLSDVTSDDYFTALNPSLPNPFSAGYEADLSAYFDANYKP